MKQQTGSKLGKEYIKAVYCHPAYMQSTSCEMPGWIKHKLESGLLGEISITSDMLMTPPLWQKVKRKWRASWWKWEEWKSWLKAPHSKNQDHGIQSHHFMADRWGNNGNSDRLDFWGAPKSLQMVTAAMKWKDAWSLGEKLWPTHRQHIKKQRHYITKVHLVKAMVFPSSHVWMWQLDHKESWALKN